jgi:membrane protein CcdC involved in cytochrome C biogenesis
VGEHFIYNQAEILPVARVNLMRIFNFFFFVSAKAIEAIAGGLIWSVILVRVK